ncbi:MAG: NADH:ubiquinone reductase (Na(+)-transporting) subunit F [Alphaproteobacteria bacterium]|nr:NADH:ubiquinone reductase (Na(+)-transporting) subunit F [Alphaproteobacteria bacterium]
MSVSMIIGLAVAVFTGLILLLVAMLMVARSQLVPQGDVTITINESKQLKVKPGSSLLSTLAAEKVFIPSACGGGGTCAQCKCQVIDGGGDVLPTETGHLTLRERKDHWRLGCQVRVKQDMKIEVPEEIFGIQRFPCTVKSNDNCATFIKELVLDIDDGKTLDFKAGGYIQIDIPRYELAFTEFDIGEEYREDWDKFKVWDYRCKNAEDGVYRAYSMANHPAEGQIVMLNVRIATPPRGLDVPPGIASSYIFNLKPGDKVTISGPYGEFFIQDTQREMIYVGGGAGMAPLRAHLFHLFHTLKTGRKVSYWYGARSLREMFYWEHFTEIEKEFPNFRFVLALSDPMPQDDWKGPTGFIHQVLLDDYLKDHDAPEDCEYYMCGPPPMVNAVMRMLDSLGVAKEDIHFDDFGG